VKEILIGFDLLDRQILDRDGYSVGKVDDVELTPDDDGALRVTALLVGPQALGLRIGGRLGTWISGAASRLHPDEHPDPIRIPYELVDKRTSAIQLSVSHDDLPEPTLETWLRDHVIARIPGADRAGG
jgi:sporulation protein YlmC with PRC-barrel domain